MQRSSPSIAALASALAKAQQALENPEKSLVGSIKAQRGARGNGDRESSGAGGETERLFRYASLASGLDIVRKTLGQHEIATVQTTAIDQGAGTVNLTTMLAHSSGEWIASDWPVCMVADTAEPHLMGAALTYARRYALFTLVGIAGEDDLDAPDLITPAAQKQGHTASYTGGQNGKGSNRPSNGFDATRGGRSGSPSHTTPTPALTPEQSAAQRDLLLTELATVSSASAATGWAQRTLPIKNMLTEPDARQVEDAFAAKLATFEVDHAEPGQVIKPREAKSPRPNVRPSPSPRRGEAIDKAVLTFPEPRRIRDKEHIRFVAKQPCLVCGRQPADAHHLRFAQSRALSRKVSDEFTVPMCRTHHREVHRCGDEGAWWKTAKIDAMAAARVLWLTTHPRILSHKVKPASKAAAT
jgi:hypothetical protein